MRHARRLTAIGSLLALVAWTAAVDDDNEAPEVSMGVSADRYDEARELDRLHRAEKLRRLAAAEEQRKAAAAAEAAAAERAERERRASATEARRDVSRSRAASAGVWHALGECESHNNPRAVSPSGKYRGAFQHSLSTWRASGGTGDPIDHSYEEQLRVAQRTQQLQGWGAWPTCAARLGLV